MIVWRARLARLLLSCALVPSTSAAQAVSEARVQELVRYALAQQPQAAQPAPGSPLPAGPVLDLAIDEAVARALERNLDIAVERLNPQALDFSIAAVRGAYTPVVNSTLARNFIVQLPTSQLIGGTRVENQTGTANVGASWALPWLGGSVAAAWNNRRQESTNLFTTFSPQFNTAVSFGYAQPLLRNLRIDGTRQQLAVTRINRDISEEQLRATITNTIASVRNAYWDLVAARQAVDVAERSLSLANKLVEDNKVRVEVGALAPIDVYQAESEAASRRQSLAQAESAARTAELALKRLVVSGTDDPLWSASVTPTDRPEWNALTIDLPGAIRKALEARTDLTQARKQIESSQVNVRYLRDQSLPAVDLSVYYGLQGIGGTRYQQGQVVAPGGYGDAWEVMWNRDYPQCTSSADAGYARAKLQLSQAQTQLRQLELQVATEVTTIASQLSSNLQRVEAATSARELAAKRLEAEQSKFEVGMSTNFFVVQAQRDLFDAELTELRARLDYQKSLVDFDRAQQTSLSRPSLTGVTTAGIGGTRYQQGQVVAPGGYGDAWEVMWNRDYPQ
ncbi:MAG: TolC family protein, partial [Vicinamibacterales bacterium]|nr:TolC family protein [Vicinamibacterales bacterium]